MTPDSGSAGAARARTARRSSGPSRRAARAGAGARSATPVPPSASSLLARDRPGRALRPSRALDAVGAAHAPSRRRRDAPRPCRRERRCRARRGSGLGSRRDRPPRWLDGLPGRCRGPTRCRDRHRHLRGPAGGRHPADALARGQTGPDRAARRIDRGGSPPRTRSSSIGAGCRSCAAARSGRSRGARTRRSATAEAPGGPGVDRPWITRLGLASNRESRGQVARQRRDGRLQ